MPKEVDLVVHWVSTGIVTHPKKLAKKKINIVKHTESVYKDYDLFKNGNLTEGKFIDRHAGADGLANTTGALAHRRVAGFRSDVTLPVGGDHIEMGGNGALGVLVGMGIALDYTIYWTMNRMGWRQ